MRRVRWGELPSVSPGVPTAIEPRRARHSLAPDVSQGSAGNSTYAPVRRNLNGPGLRKERDRLGHRRFAGLAFRGFPKDDCKYGASDGVPELLTDRARLSGLLALLGVTGSHLKNDRH